MKQLIYHSQPFGFDRAMLGGILLQARRNNRRDAITGALVCRHDLYLQLIEGPDAAIEAVYARIARDDRHCDVRLLTTAWIETRMFPEWDMLDDPSPTLTWSCADVERGAVGAATPVELHAVFARVAAAARAGGVAASRVQ